MQHRFGECYVVAWQMGMLVETDLQVQNLRSDLGVSAVVDLKRLNSKVGDGCVNFYLLTRSIHGL
jgi:hypothetical protein